MKQLLDGAIAAAKDAGSRVMEIYQSDDFAVTQKDDNSPLTKADIASHHAIEAGLAKLEKTYPMICEEGTHEAPDASVFWLVDPLDGTKEFIKRNGEFTVNIALIDEGEPVLGVVYAPAIDTLYYAARGVGAFKQAEGHPQPILSVFGKGTPKIVTSRSHKSAETARLLEKIGSYQEISMGSSLKLCLVAEGAAILYPRLAPTYGWDTAAADAVVRFAGGSVRDLAGKALAYPPKATKNPFFIVRSQDSTF